MSKPMEDELAAFVVGIMGDPFNRSLRALEDAGAIDTTILRSNY